MQLGHIYRATIEKELLRAMEQRATYKTDKDEERPIALPLTNLDINGVVAALMFAAARRLGLVSGGPEIDEELAKRLLKIALSLGMEIDPEAVELVLAMMEELEGVERR